jgi:hypothetical protein
MRTSFRDKKGFADKLNAERDQQFYYKEFYQMRNVKPLSFKWLKFDLAFTFYDVMNKLAYWDPRFGWKSFTVRYLAA